MAVKMLGKMLVDEQMVTEEQLEDALAEQRKTGDPLGEVMVRQGHLSEEALYRFLAIQHGLDFEHLEQFTVTPDLLKVIPGAAAPRLVTTEMVERMHTGSVLVDISIDQGGCFETSRPTTHENPIYSVKGVVHYCVANMPGAVPRTSAFALNNATLPYVLALADKGPARALAEDRHLLHGLNVHRGRITHAAVAAALGLDHFDPRHALGS